MGFSAGGAPLLPGTLVLGFRPFPSTRGPLGAGARFPAGRGLGGGAGALWRPPAVFFSAPGGRRAVLLLTPSLPSSAEPDRPEQWRGMWRRP